jgi:hypothetical protein
MVGGGQWGIVYQYPRIVYTSQVPSAVTPPPVSWCPCCPCRHDLRRHPSPLSPRSPSPPPPDPPRSPSPPSHAHPPRAATVLLGRVIPGGSPPDGCRPHGDGCWGDPSDPCRRGAHRSRRPLCGTGWWELLPVLTVSSMYGMHIPHPSPIPSASAIRSTVASGWFSRWRRTSDSGTPLQTHLSTDGLSPDGLPGGWSPRFPSSGSSRSSVPSISRLRSLPLPIPVR